MHVVFSPRMILNQTKIIIVIENFRCDMNYNNAGATGHDFNHTKMLMVLQ